MKSLSVLIVDDSSVMRRIVERSLRQTGLGIEKVLEADNGVEALKILQTEEIDLVFSDLNMPKMDGLEFLRQSRRDSAARRVPFLMITTEGSQSKVVEAISLGAQGYIRKPFTADQVKAQVTSALNL
ncbi:MAG: response regulator [Terriglobia bacterium]